jgi:hypothetical protein
MEARRDFPLRSCRDFRPINSATHALDGVSLARVWCRVNFHHKKIGLADSFLNFSAVKNLTGARLSG